MGPPRHKINYWYDRNMVWEITQMAQSKINRVAEESRLFRYRLRKGGPGGRTCSGLAPIQQAEIQGGAALVIRYPGAQGYVQGAV
jgi:hypothetical protein